MDSMHHQHQQSNPNHQESQNLVDGDGYGYNNVPNDFNHFFNNDPNPAFNASWEAQTLVDPQIQTSNYPQGHESWPSNPLNSANALNPSTYAFPSSRDYGQSYPPNPPPFRYTSFDAPPSHPYSTSHYDPRLASYGHDPILTPGYEISRNQYGASNLQGQTISPQALQSYPNAYGQYDQEPPYAQNATSRRGQPGNVPQDAYSNVPAEALNANIPKGVPQGNFLVKDATALAAATNSRKVAGFIFVGNSPVRSDGPQGSIQRPAKRKSKNEIKQRVIAHQNGREWSEDQKQLLKELNISRKKPRIGSQGISTPNSAASPSAASDSSSRSESESSSGDSDYDSESEDEKEADMEPSPLPPVRPEDSVKAVEYDIIKIVWHRSKSNLSGPAIRTALGEYWDLIKGIRDQWRADLQALAEAEEKKDQYRIKQSKRRALEQRQMLEVAIAATVQHGHQDVVGRLGENELLFLAFYQLMADRFKESDFSGPMMLNILQLMVRCTTIDRALIEKVKLDKVLPKLIKKGDEKIKALAQKVLDSVALSKPKDATNKPSPVPVNGTSKSTGSASSSSSASARTSDFLKKQRDGITPTLPAKKLVPPLSKPGSVASAKSGTISIKGAQVLKEVAAAKSVASATTTNGPTGKVKVNHVVPKTSTFFSSLQSASKKPGTSNAAKAAQQADSKASKTTDSKNPASSTSTAPPPPPKPTFSFAETMANLTKPKEAEPSTKPAENLPPETEEEKAKRLRKETRRKLRVSFKPDDTLVDTRYFVHDPEEEVGPDDSMIRDVGDIGSEGRMLKMHKGLDEMDEDEDSTTNEITLAPWNPPSLVDFSSIDPAELDRNIITRGGKVEVKSQEHIVQEQRELNTLMAFYASPADIPPNPREPVDPYSGETIKFYEFGDPSAREEFIKIRQAQFYAERNPQMQAYNPPLAQSTTIPTTNISELLRMLNAQPQVSQPHQPQLTSAPVSGLEAVFAQFAANSNTPQVTQMQTPQLSVLDPSFAATLAAVNGFVPQPQQAQAQISYVPPPAQTQAPTVDLSSIIATLGQYNNMQQPPQQQYNYQNAYQADNNDRKRGYDYDSQDNHYSDEKRSRGSNGKKTFQYRGPKVPCKFWQEGKCKKGDECTYLHVHE